MEKSERLQALQRIIMSLQLQHILFYKYKQKFVKRIDRLDYLLWGKSLEYEGPLYDGFQPNEWAFIAVLVGAWFIETYKLYRNSSKQENLDSLFTKENISNLSIQLIKKIVKNQLIKTTEQDKKNMEIFLATMTIKNFIENELSDTIIATKNLLMELGCCCGISKSHMQNNLYKSTELKGLSATSVNKYKGINIISI